MIFREAGPADIGQLTELRIAYLAEDTGPLTKADADILRRDLPDYFTRNLNRTIFGYAAESDGHLTACALLLVTEKPMSPAFMTGKVGTVLNVYTTPAYRRRGYGRLLMEMLLAAASSMRLSAVELKSTEDGYRLYQSLGFRDAASKYHPMIWREELPDGDSGTRNP